MAKTTYRELFNEGRTPREAANVLALASGVIDEIVYLPDGTEKYIKHDPDS